MENLKELWGEEFPLDEIIREADLSKEDIRRRILSIAKEKRPVNFEDGFEEISIPETIERTLSRGKIMLTKYLPALVAGLVDRHVASSTVGSSCSCWDSFDSTNCSTTPLLA